MIVSVIYPDDAKPGEKFYVEEIDVDAARGKVKIVYETLRPSIAEKDWDDQVDRVLDAVENVLLCSECGTQQQTYLAIQGLKRLARALPSRPTTKT